MSKGSLALALVTLAVVVGYVEVRMPAPVSEAPPAERVDLAPLEAGIASIREDVAEIKDWRDGVDAWREASAGGTAPGAAPPAKRPDQPAAAKKVDPKRTELARAFLKELEAGKLSREKVDEMWDYLSGSGLESEAIAAFAAYTKENPKDPDGWYGLGAAQISKLMMASNTMETMLLSGAADKSFDKALAIDDNHFSARFSKAISYTFYPSIAGKAPEAIKHFEILAERHGNDATRGEMVMVFQNLGQEYLKMGNPEKAKAAFERGLGTFPDSKVLKDQLKAMEK